MWRVRVPSSPSDGPEQAPELLWTSRSVLQTLDCDGLVVEAAQGLTSTQRALLHHAGCRDPTLDVNLHRRTASEKRPQVRSPAGVVVCCGSVGHAGVRVCVRVCVVGGYLD